MRGVGVIPCLLPGRTGLLEGSAAAAEVDASIVIHVDPMVRVEQPLHLDVIARVER
jgi:hypothetical protein